MPRKKVFNEQEVLEKAMELFWTQGYSATSVQDLVTHLGINRASLYDTFGDKRQLFISAFRLYQKTNSTSIQAFLEAQPDVLEGLKSLFYLAIDQAAADQNRKGCFVVNTTTELIPNDQEFLDILDQNKIDFQAVFREYLQQGKSNGQIKADTDLDAAALMLFTMYNGLRVVTKINPDKEAQQKSINLMISQL